jgi:hypothetical protein
MRLRHVEVKHPLLCWHILQMDVCVFGIPRWSVRHVLYARGESSNQPVVSPALHYFDMRWRHSSRFWVICCLYESIIIDRA